MTQNQIGSPEQRLALNVCYGIIGTVGIAILCRDLGVGLSVVPWVLYAIFATPMIVMLSHREICRSRMGSTVNAPRFSWASTTRRFLFCSASCPAVLMTSLISDASCTVYNLLAHS